MSNTVLMIKLVKKDTENDSIFHAREKLYKEAIEKHNMMVWATISKVYGGRAAIRHLFKDKLYKNIMFTNEMGMETSFEKMVDADTRYKMNTPYYDSGFDVFQPLGKYHVYSTPNGETKDYSLEEGTHLIGLGLKTAMYEITNNMVPEVINLLRKITIYHNLNNITLQTLGDYSQRRFNMLHKTEWHNQIPTPFKLHPRSSIYKKSFRQANCTGIIDTGYRGELGAAVDCLGQKYGRQTDMLRTTLEKGKRYFQICRADLKPFYVMLVNEQDELPSTERGEGGFGSTGQ